LAPFEVMGRIDALYAARGGLPHVVTLDRVDPAAGEVWTDPQVQPDDLAFLQYTSGTTGQPKGVMIPHRAACDNIRRIGHLLGLMAADRSVGWLPPFHDMGVPIVWMAPESFLQRPLRWLEAVSQFEATITTGPNFAWQLCVDALKASGGEAAKGGLKLDSLRKFLTGAERVRPETLREFAAAFGQFGFDERCMLPVWHGRIGSLVDGPADDPGSGLGGFGPGSWAGAGKAAHRLP
jgi:acyl-CoA synthetase (AMP-forming)/AMP-acid ligase II